MKEIFFSVVIPLGCLISGMYLGFVLHRYRASNVFSALKAIMEYHGPGTLPDTLFMQAAMAINDYLGIKPKCGTCKHLTEWDCNQPDCVVDGENFCTGYEKIGRSKNV